MSGNGGDFRQNGLTLTTFPAIFVLHAGLVACVVTLANTRIERQVMKRAFDKAFMVDIVSLVSFLLAKMSGR